MNRSKNTPPGSIAMSLSNALALLTLACLFSSVSAAGEDAPLDLSLTPGMRVRILAPDISPSRVIGTIRAVNRESVTIDAPGHAEPVSVLREKIARLDISEGSRSRGVDAAIGTGIGAGVGAIVGAVSGSNQKNNQVVHISTAADAGIVALFGALIGAVIGAVVPPGERWDEMPATRYRVGFAPRPDHGLDMAIAWRF